MQMINLDISLRICIWEMIPVMCVKQSTNQMNGILVPSKTRNGEQHLAREKPHTRYATNMRAHLLSCSPNLQPK